MLCLERIILKDYFRSLIFCWRHTQTFLFWWVFFCWPTACLRGIPMYKYLRDLKRLHRSLTLSGTNFERLFHSVPSLCRRTPAHCYSRISSSILNPANHGHRFHVRFISSIVHEALHHVEQWVFIMSIDRIYSRIIVLFFFIWSWDLNYYKCSILLFYTLIKSRLWLSYDIMYNHDSSSLS